MFLHVEISRRTFHEFLVAYFLWVIKLFSSKFGISKSTIFELLFEHFSGKSNVLISHFGISGSTFTKFWSPIFVGIQTFYVRILYFRHEHFTKLSPPKKLFSSQYIIFEFQKRNRLFSWIIKFVFTFWIRTHK